MAERVVVVGVGPIGGVLSAHLAKAGVEVTVVDVIPEIVEKVRADGITVTGPAAEKTHGEFTTGVAGAVSDFAEAPEAEVVFVCTKTTVVEAVASSLKKAWRSGALLVSFQNGIDPEEVLAEVAGRDATLRVVVNYAGNARAPGVYAMNWFSPPNYVGALSEAGRPGAERVAKMLNDARLTSTVVDDIKKYAYEKTALNATLCPICALTGMTMGEAMADDGARELVRGILEEARAVGEAVGWSFEHTFDDWMDYLSKGGPHKPSMAVDMDAGRRTEIYFMNGKICEHGRRVGVPTPYNDSMYWTVLARERKTAGRTRGD